MSVYLFSWVFLCFLCTSFPLQSVSVSVTDYISPTTLPQNQRRIDNLRGAQPTFRTSDACLICFGECSTCSQCLNCVVLVLVSVLCVPVLRCVCVCVCVWVPIRFCTVDLPVHSPHMPMFSMLNVSVYCSRMSIRAWLPMCSLVAAYMIACIHMCATSPPCAQRTASSALERLRFAVFCVSTNNERKSTLYEIERCVTNPRV